MIDDRAVAFMISFFEEKNICFHLCLSWFTPTFNLRDGVNMSPFSLLTERQPVQDVPCLFHPHNPCVDEYTLG